MNNDQKSTQVDTKQNKTKEGIIPKIVKPLTEPIKKVVNLINPFKK